MSQPLLPKVNGEAQSRLDIISNARRVLELRDGQLESAPKSLILAGVWETQIETDLLGRGSDTPIPATELTNLRLYTEADLRSHSDTDGITSRMLREAESGYLVLGDADPNSTDNNARWWRVDPVTGETLGMSLSGGAVTVELLGKLIIAFLILNIVNLSLIAWCVGEDGSLPTCVMCGSAPLFLFAGAIAGLRALLSGALDSTGYFQEEFELIQRWCEQSAS